MFGIFQKPLFPPYQICSAQLGKGSLGGLMSWGTKDSLFLVLRLE